MVNEHVHRNGNGGLQTDQWGRVEICRSDVCFRWATSNARLVNTVGAGAVGALIGALIGASSGKTGLGAIAGASIGAGFAHLSQSDAWPGPFFEGLPLLPPHPRLLND